MNILKKKYSLSLLSIIERKLAVIQTRTELGQFESLLNSNKPVIIRLSMLILRLYVYTLADKTSTEAPSTSCWTSYGTLICLHTGEFEVRHEIVSFSSVK